MAKDDSKIIELTQERVEIAKPKAATKIGTKMEIPRLSIDIIQNRWRAYSKHGTFIEVDPDVAKIVEAALEAIVRTDIIVDQRDIYYSLRMGHPDWKLAGHDLKTEEAYNTFVGAVMEKLQLWTGYTMQSLGVRAGPRGYITGDDKSYFVGVKLPSGKTDNVSVSASPVIQFNLVDAGVEFQTQARKLIHYEKAAGMNSLLVNDMATMIEALFMTSQGYNVEAATKMHRDMENRGLRLFVLGDADPHGMSIQLMYGRASKSNAYMPDSFYPKQATLLGLFPRIANALQLPAEHVADIHMRVVPNLKRIMQETRPDMLPDAEIFEKERKQWEWQSLNGLGPETPSVYLVESLRAKNDEIKYVPDEATVKTTLQETIREMVEEFVNDEVEKYARNWLLDNLKDDLVSQLKDQLSNQITKFTTDAERELGKLDRMTQQDLREAIKLKLVKNPKQYWTDGIRKVIADILSQKFDITATIDGSAELQSADVDQEVTVSNPEVPPQPLTKDDIVESIEKRLTGKKALIQRIRQAVESVLGHPSQNW